MSEGFYKDFPDFMSYLKKLTSSLIIAFLFWICYIRVSSALINNNSNNYSNIDTEYQVSYHNQNSSNQTLNNFNNEEYLLEYSLRNDDNINLIPSNYKGGFIIDVAPKEIFIDAYKIGKTIGHHHGKLLKQALTNTN